MSHLTYKGYIGSIEPQLDSGKLFGKLLSMRDLVTYEADTLPDLEREFIASVDAYLASCEEIGRTPQKPFKGTFNVRTGEDLHRLATIASGTGSLNNFVCEAISEKLDRMGISE